MRILYYHQFFTTRSGSGGTRSYEMARALIESGHEVTIVCSEHNRGQLGLSPDSKYGGTRGDVEGIDVIALPMHYSNHQNLVERARTFLKYALGGVRVAFSEPHDLLFATSTPLTAGLPGIAMKLFGRRSIFVFEVRDLWPELPRALGVTNPLVLLGMDALEWLSYRAADRCIGLAPGIVRGIERRARRGLPISMIPNGCDLDLFQPKLRAPLRLEGIADGDFVAGFTGAHGIANGLDAVIETAIVLQRRGLEAIKFLLIGEGSEKAGLLQRAKEAGLRNCIFLPLMPKLELAKITASLDVGLQILKDVPAFYYGTSPNKFFDYLAAGIPVLTNYPGWIADLVTTHDLGVAVPPREPEAFADALLAMSREPSRVERQGCNARKLAETEFGRGLLAERFVRFLTSSSD